MANTNTKPTAAPPDWRQREHNRRMNWVLILLVLLGLLVAFYYYLSFLGNVGTVNGLTFDTSNYIAFVRQDDKGNSTLFAIRADGTDLRPLTPSDDVSNKEQPVWTLDGKSLIYASNLHDNKVTQIYILGTGTPKQLTYGPGNKSYPIILSDGKRAGFIVQGAVKSVNLNGTDVLQLLPPPILATASGNEAVPDASASNRPFLSADFASNDFETNRGVAGTQDVGGTEPNAPSADQVVMVIPDGFVHPDGSSTLVALDAGHEVSFAWEPHGNRLATCYTEQEIPSKDPKAKPVVISGIRIWSFEKPKEHTGAERSASSDPTPSQNAASCINLFLARGYSVEPKHIAWSPDGSKISCEIWQLKGEGIRELRGIVVMDAHQPGPPVTPETINSVLYMVPAGPDGLPQNPRWSPDGTRLLYESQRRDGKRDLWIINADGTNKINLTKGQGDNTEGSWSPLIHKL